jgi:hypothetical protein
LLFPALLLAALLFPALFFASLLLAALLFTAGLHVAGLVSASILRLLASGLLTTLPLALRTHALPFVGALSLIATGTLLVAALALAWRLLLATLLATFCGAALAALLLL